MLARLPHIWNLYAKLRHSQGFFSPVWRTQNSCADSVTLRIRTRQETE